MNFLNPYVLFGFWLALSSINIFSQNYFVKKYSVENGFQTQGIYSSSQDNDGRIWFATKTGVTVYDGLSCINYGPDQGLPKETYYKIKVDKFNTVWALPQFLNKPIAYFSKGKWDTIPSLKIPGCALISSLAFDISYKYNKSVLYIGTNCGVLEFKEGNWNILTEKNNLLSDFIYSITIHNGLLYIVTSKGLSVYDGSKFDNKINDLIPENRKNFIVLAFDSKNEDGKLWLMGTNFIGYIYKNRYYDFNKNFSLSSLNISDFVFLHVSSNDKIIFGNRYSKFYADNQKVYSLFQKNGFSSNGATSVLVDREGNTWFTDLRGVDKISNFYVKNYSESTGLLANEVSALLETGPDEFIIGHNNGFTFMKKGETKRIEFPMIKIEDYTAQRVLDLAGDDKGNIWAACSYRGICKINKSGSVKFIKIPGTQVVASIRMLKDKIMYALTTQGIYKIIDDIPQKVNYANQTIRSFRKIFAFNNDGFYLTSNSGVFYCNYSSMKQIFSTENNLSNYTYSVFRLKNNDLLVGTEDGLYCVVGGKISKWNLDGQRIDKSVYALEQDHTGNLWIGTNDGFYKWNGKKLLVRYAKEEGLAGREINRSAFKMDSFNHFWVGTEQGLSCFLPETISKKIPVPNVLLRSLKLTDGMEFSLINDIYLENEQNTFKPDFCGVSFIDESGIEYKYKLEGHEKEWNYVSQNQADKLWYTHLPFGSYRLTVMAKNQYGEWSRPVSSGLIIIGKPFYLKSWFLLMAAFLCLLSGYAVFKIFILRAYNSNLEKQVNNKTVKLIESELQLRIANEDLEKRVYERTNELEEAYAQLQKIAEEQKDINKMKDKFFSIVAHDLKSPFMGLSGLTTILKNEFENLPKEKIKRYIDLINASTINTYDLIDNLLQWSRLQIKDIVFEPDYLNLNNEISRIQELMGTNAFNKGINIQNLVDPNLKIFADKKMLRSILQNLCSNAVKFTSKGGLIQFSASENGKYVEVMVSDTGVGIAPGNLKKLFRLDEQISMPGTEDEKGTGLGLSICKEMIEKHNGTIRVESIPAEGSRFIFTLPKPENN